MNETIPKDLPKTNPLLFSFLAILDALKENVVFSGKYERGQDKVTPAFEYAVNSWSILYDDTSSLNGEKKMQMRVSCAIWNEKEDLGDCGVTWNSVWYKDGSDLATTASTQDAYYPRPAEWASAGINLAAYDGTAELMVRFKGISQFGNNLYVDDIMMVNSDNVSLEENTVLSSVNVYPFDQ